MADINIDGVVTWLKNWFYDKTEIIGFLNNKANQSDLQTLQGTVTTLSGTIDNKVDKVTGKGLSTEDFTTALKDKLDEIEAQANNITVDTALDTSSTNPVENKAVATSLNGKAPKSHASSSTGYGVGTTSNYGHNKIIDSLDKSSLVNGESLSAHQGYVLDQNKADADHSHGIISNDGKVYFNDGLVSSVDTGDFIIITDASDGNKIAKTVNLPAGRVNDSAAYVNIGTGANATQSTINSAINDKLGTLSSLDVINVTSNKGTASADTMNKLYIEDNGTTVDVYYTQRSGTSPNYTYSWHKMDADILDELSIDWADIENKPTIPTDVSDLTDNNNTPFTPKSHTHGVIQSNGCITSVSQETLLYVMGVVSPVQQSGQNCLKTSNKLSSTVLNDANAHTNIGTNANTNQTLINIAIDTAIGTKGALTDDVDWTYSDNGFTNGVKLVSKTDNANGRITLHLKSIVPEIIDDFETPL